jgi:hypothetical protein
MKSSNVVKRDGGWVLGEGKGSGCGESHGAFYTVGVGITLLPCAFMRLAGDHVVEAFSNKCTLFSPNMVKSYCARGHSDISLFP